jgi:hypothetical protein
MALIMRIRSPMRRKKKFLQVSAPVYLLIIQILFGVDHAYPFAYEEGKNSGRFTTIKNHCSADFSEFVYISIRPFRLLIVIYLFPLEFLPTIQSPYIKALQR